MDRNFDGLRLEPQYRDFFQINKLHRFMKLFALYVRRPSKAVIRIENDVAIEGRLSAKK